MTNGTSQGLFVIVAVVIFGIFVFISYLLFRDTMKPTLAHIFTDSLSQVTDNFSQDSSNTTEEKYFMPFTSPQGFGFGTNGLTEEAYNEDGTIKDAFKTVILPEQLTVSSEPTDIVFLDFVNNNQFSSAPSHFEGVEKLVGNTNLTHITTIDDRVTTLKELDLSKTKIDELGNNFLSDNKSITKLTLGKNFKTFGAYPFLRSNLEELILTNTTPINGVENIFSGYKEEKIKITAPKELKEQLEPYREHFKELNYY